MADRGDRNIPPVKELSGFFHFQLHYKLRVGQPQTVLNDAADLTGTVMKRSAYVLQGGFRVVMLNISENRGIFMLPVKIISRDILRWAGVDNPIVTAASHNVGMLLRLSLYGVGACVCPQKIVQSVLTPQQMDSVWLFPLGAETVGCIQFGYQAQSYQWSVIEEFILCAKAVVC